MDNPFKAPSQDSDCQYRSNPQAHSTEEVGRHRWRRVGSFSTLAAAEATVRQLEAEGVVSTISLVGGLSVIAKG